ncbi:hypothetical protein [Streptomyces griseocarneus]|uniref:Polyketide synthase n=1 Tax=Streptomyces griseocarneus TaxID=51201 RepID=A0ABX7RP20_9ACTN|nr:hypothetical protein [Streptomyces griseocarneus]QSY50029.1 hypothetical protein J3S04_02885 [Streptomyces griseocarneus]
MSGSESVLSEFEAVKANAVAVVGSAHRPPEECDAFDAEFLGLRADDAEDAAATGIPGGPAVLELLWEAMEDAGLTPTTVAGHRPTIHLAGDTPDGTGDDAARAVARALRLDEVTLTRAGTEGRAALDAACEDLRRGTSPLALAAGPSLPARTSAGLGALLLKPLARALADGDDIQHLLRPGAEPGDPWTWEPADALRAALRAAAPAPRPDAAPPPVRRCPGSSPPPAPRPCAPRPARSTGT